jgi:hypothetical protein
LLERLETAPHGSLGADYTLAQARIAQQESRHDVAVELYQQLVRAVPEPERQYVHQFPLARSLDALGRYDEAFAAATAAHESQAVWIRRTSPDIVQRRSDTMRITRFGCDVADVTSWDHTGAPDYEESPVFIVAFPRSGTTLLEQVLDANPLLRSMDEQPYLQNALEALDAPQVHYPDSMRALTPVQLGAARAHYWSLVRQRVTLEPGQRLIDKNPLNILRLPAIARLFPHARTIIAIRHPLDVLVSCFMQHFRAEFAWHCRDMSTLGLAFRRTMDFWHEQAALLAPRIHEVRYETFVANFGQGVRDVAAFLELPWTDAMLTPGEHARDKGFISTPSYSQVVQPVHSKSVDRWRAYTRHLQPALEHVRPWLERWSYEVPVQNNR